MTTTTKDRPIIFGAESIRAILDGRKTQTRRVIKPQPWWIESPHIEGDKWVGAYSKDTDITNPTYQARCPYPIGSRLWVRETWCPYADEMTKQYCQEHDSYLGEPIKPAVYASDYSTDCNPLDVGGCERWHSPIFMPRWASRITLEVVGIRAERLQEITYDDLLAEGWDPSTSEPFSGGTAGDDARLWFELRWRALRPDSSPYCYDLNPWVWVVEFAVAGGDR